MKKQIFHHYKMWEDYRYGFYDNISGEKKEKKIKSCIDYFNNKTLVDIYMNRVVKEWVYSCQQYFTNPSVNKIAYLGQASACLYDSIPNTVTMKAWGLLDEGVRDYSNKIAIETIKKWEKQNKNIQLCISSF